MTRALVVLRALGLGDLLTAVPALHALRRTYPDHRIELCTPAWLAPIKDAPLASNWNSAILGSSAVLLTRG